MLSKHGKNEVKEAQIGPKGQIVQIIIQIGQAEQNGQNKLKQAESGDMGQNGMIQGL